MKSPPNVHILGHFFLQWLNGHANTLQPDSSLILVTEYKHQGTPVENLCDVPIADPTLMADGRQS